jgi:hypothetical protein
LIFGFVIFLPQFFLRRAHDHQLARLHGRAAAALSSAARSARFYRITSAGAGALSGIVSHHRAGLGLFALQRRSDPVIVLSVGAI